MPFVGFDFCLVSSFDSRNLKEESLGVNESFTLRELFLKQPEPEKLIFECLEANKSSFYVMKAF